MNKCLIALVVILSSLVAACTSTPPIQSPSTKQQNVSVPAILMSALQGKHLHYLHVEIDSSLREGDIVTPGQQIGRVQQWPAVLSETNDSQLKAGMQSYDKGDYSAAFKAFQPLFETESDNEFYLYYYAKTLFWFDNQRDFSRQLFEMLRIKIEEQYLSDDRTFIVDFWFPDLYWKLANFNLDKREYAEAVVNIALTLSSGYEEGSAKLEQPLSYLAEAYYFLDNKEYNNSLVDYVQAHFPDNKYVKRFRLR